MRFLLHLDSRLSTGPNNGQCFWALGQGIVGAAKCRILALRFLNAIGTTTAITFSSTQLTPSDQRFVVDNSLAITQPFLLYVVDSIPGALDGPAQINRLMPTFALSGQGFNSIDVLIRDAETNTILTGMGAWTMELEFFVP